MSVKAGDDFLIVLEARGDLALGPEDWTEVTHGTVRQILISHGDAINSIQVAYSTNGSGTLILAHRHGGGGDRYDCINLGVGESLTMVKGSYGPVGRSSASVVRSLTFGSSRAIYGPFGMEEGAPFCFNIPSGVSFGGFHGRSDHDYLRAIGIYVRSIAKYHYSPKPDNIGPGRQAIHSSTGYY